MRRANPQRIGGCDATESCNLPCIHAWVSPPLCDNVIHVLEMLWMPPCPRARKLER